MPRIAPALSFERLEDRTLLASAVTASLVDAIAPGGDADADGVVDPGDTIRYTVDITETGGMDATGVMLDITLDPNLTLVPNSTLITPIALDDTYDIVGNVHRTVNAANGLLANDIDIDAATPFSNVGLEVVTASVTDIGGTATNGTFNVNTDGSFTYTPVIGTTGTDIFTYNIVDADNLNNVVTGQVTFAIGAPIWFVDNTAPAGGDGSFANPFDDFSELTGGADPDAPGDTIFVFEGTGTLTDTITLENFQTLHGEGVALQRTLDGVLTTIIEAGDAPTLTSPTGNIITLAATNTIRGVNIGNTAVGNHGIVGLNFGTVTISDVSISGTGGLLSLNNGEAAIEFDNLASTSSTGIIPLDINSLIGQFEVLGQTSISGAAAGGVEITNGSAAFTFNDLDIATVNTRGLLVSTSNIATLAVADGTISTGSGQAVSIDGTTIGVVSFESISVNGASNAIFLRNTGSSGEFHITGDGSGAQNGSGGTLQNTVGAAMTFNNAGNFDIRSIDITNPASGRGISLDNAIGVNFLRSARITGIGSNQTGIDWDNDSAGGAALSVQSTLFQGAMGVTSSRGIEFGSSANYNATLTIDDTGGVAADSIFERLQRQAVSAVTGTTSSGTVNVTIRDTIFRNAEDATNGYNGLQFSANGAASMIVLLDDLTLNSIARSGAGTSTINVISGGNGTITGTIRDSSFVDLHTEGIRAGTGTNATGTFVFDNNDFDDIGMEAIAVAVIGDSSADVTITNNRIGTVSAVGDGQGFNGFERAAVSLGVSDNSGDVLTALIQNNTIAHTDAPSSSFNRPVLDVDVEDGDTANLTILGNTFTQHGAGEGVNLRLRGDNSASSLRVDLNSANVAANANTSNAGYALFHNGGANQGTFAFEFDLSDAVVNDAGPFTDAQIETFLSARNTGAVTTPNNQDDFDGVASVATPLLFAPPPKTPTTSISNSTDAPDPAATAAATHSDTTTDDIPVDNVPASPGPTLLTADQLAFIVDAAIDRWAATGLSAEQLARLEATHIQISTLGGFYLGFVQGGSITIDNDAAGNGWFVDATPLDDSEYTAVSGTRLTGGPQQVDLLTTVMHEMGHILGLPDLDPILHADNLLAGYLTLGERRLPAAGQASGVRPHNKDHDRPEFMFTTLNLDTLPANKALRIIFDATVDNLSGGIAPTISTQGQVSGDNISTVQTDDPDPGGSTDPTTTTLDSLTLGNQVWIEQGTNSVFDMGTDAAPNGVTVNLYADDGDGVLDPGDGAPIATTATMNIGGTDGRYEFTSLLPGEYIVEVLPTGPLAGLVSLAGAVDPDNNVDDDDNGAPVAGFGVASQAITLDDNTEPTPGAGNDVNTTLDFGFIANTMPTATDDGFNVDEDQVLSGNLITDNNGNGSDSDPEMGLLAITQVDGSGGNVGAQFTLGSGALLTVNSDGTFNYDPNGVFDALESGESAVDTFTYTITDDGGLTDQATVTVTIDGVGGAVQIVGDTAIITGTPNRDSIVYRVAQKQANVNGVNYVLPSNITLVQIDGLGDKDTLNL
ncbi:MAG: hypothetical protein KDA75_10650, partial [Planctomycetaceae bacterium]|nr:hypothetical protein [Planctomycetaceae bacterium]